MSVRLSDETEERISEAMFSDFKDTPAENFLRQELERYAPQMRGMNDEEIRRFVNYQRAVYLSGALPTLGRPVASLNPAFIDSIDAIVLEKPGFDVYTRASVKENGYRMQLHNGPADAKAFTRQFTSYDLRMFPELMGMLQDLPVMIGDAELINRDHPHLAGFHRVNARLPDATHWPARGSDMIDDEFLNRYLSNKDMFEKRMPKDEFTTTLAFHGMLAIADPLTWKGSPEEQFESLTSLCPLPMDYKRVDTILDKLAEYIAERKLPARVVERKQIADRAALEQYIKDKEAQDLEGVVVVQCATDTQGDRTFNLSKSFKIKKYETVDCALLGLYLKTKEQGLREDNVSGALLGLYDTAVRRYVPVHKTNLDPEGVQVKTEGQKRRLVELRRQVVDEAAKRHAENKEIMTLYERYLLNGKKLVRDTTREALGKKSMGIAERMMMALQEDMPRGHTLATLIKEFGDGSNYNTLPKKPTKLKECLYHNKQLFDLLGRVQRKTPEQYEHLLDYFSAAKEVRTVSQKFKKPQVIVGTDSPVILETQVFDITRGMSPYPAGYDPATRTSFKFNNAFADHIRHDKSSTTDYETIEAIARRNTSSV